tara:strand:+ start:5863 stop:6357 length:495 start_codon:yes stop_codon:yes gene_type:complete
MPTSQLLLTEKATSVLYPSDFTDATTVDVSNSASGLQCQYANLAKVSVAATGAADGNQVHLYAFGVNSLTSGSTTTYIPHFIGKFLCTFGTKTGVSSGVLTENEDFVDTFAKVEGDSSTRISNGTNEIATLTIDLQGAEYLVLTMSDAGLTLAASARFATVGLL